MEIIERRLGGIRKKYTIYEQDEADKLGIEYKYWREAQPGEWAITDDKYVMECIARKTYAHRKNSKKENDEITFSGAKIFDSIKTLEFLPRLKSRGFWNTSGKSWLEQEIGKQRLHNAIKLYVQQYLNGDINWDMIGNVYRPDQQIPAATVKRLFKQSKIQEMIDQEVEHYLEKQNITKKTAAELYAEAIAAARLSGKAADILKVAEAIAELVGIKTKEKITKIESIEASRTTFDLLDKDAKEIEKVKAQRRIEEEI